MEKQEYISVSEFATRLQTSKQYVYKLMKGKLQPFVVTENGKKMLRADALDVAREGVKAPFDKTPEGQSREAELVQQLLQEKDARISDLQQQLAEANKSIALLQQLLAARETQRQLEAPKRRGLFSWVKKRAPGDGVQS